MAIDFCDKHCESAVLL